MILEHLSTFPQKIVPSVPHSNYDFPSPWPFSTEALWYFSFGFLCLWVYNFVLFCSFFHVLFFFSGSKTLQKNVASNVLYLRSVVFQKSRIGGKCRCFPRVEYSDEYFRIPIPLVSVAISLHYIRFLIARHSLKRKQLEKDNSWQTQYWLGNNLSFARHKRWCCCLASLHNFNC